jgi:hypothetical protein
MLIKYKFSEVISKLEKVKQIMEERLEKCLIISEFNPEFNEEKRATYEAFIHFLKDDETNKKV